MNVTKWLNNNRNILGWLLCAGSLVGVFALAFTCEKGVDLTLLVPAILGVYISGESVKRVGTVMAAAKDPNADTEDVIRMLTGREKPTAKPASEVESTARPDSPE